MGSKQTRISQPTPLIPSDYKATPPPQHYITYNLTILSAKKGLIQQVDIKTTSTAKMINYFSEQGLVALSIDRTNASISIIIEDILTFNVPQIIQ